MMEVRHLATQALAARATAGVKVRQPLATLRIRSSKLNVRGDKELLDLLKDEVNVRDVVFDPDLAEEVSLDTKITP